MPYIEQEARKELLDRPVMTIGELNYMMSLCIIGYVNKYDLSYATIHDIYNAMEIIRTGRDRYNNELAVTISNIPISDDSEITHKDVQLTAGLAWTEFYRRIAGPYEDLKARQNGDVYE